MSDEFVALALDILAALKDGDSYRLMLAHSPSVGSCFAETP